MIVNGSELLLADEPTGALDTKNGEKIMEIFKELNSAGKTVIIITHDMKVAGAFKRVIEIQDGSIKRFWDPQADRNGVFPEREWY